MKKNKKTEEAKKQMNRRKSNENLDTINVNVTTKNNLHKGSQNTKKEDIKRKKVQKNKNVRKAMHIVITILILLMLIGVATLVYKIKKNGGGLTGTLATILDTKQLEELEPIQILVMGISGVDDYKLADTIMVVSYNPKTQQASILSIPRDTYVGKKDRTTATSNYIASYKINTVFRSGTNIDDAIDRINELTGLNLENYIIVDTDALIKIVDAIGGVTFDVPIDMNYEDSGQDLYIHLTAGEQLIDGAKAEQLLRFRHNDDGSTYPASYGMEDMGRTRTQRAFVVATLKQVLKPQNIFKLKQIVDIASANVTTNMTLSDLKSYIPYAVNFDTENIKTDVVPGTSEMCNGVSIYVANKTKTAEIVAELFSEPEEETEQEEQLSENITTTTNNETTTSIKVEVLNGSGSSSILSEVVTKLENAGYKVIKQGTTNETAKTTITNKTNQTTTEANKIKDLLGTGIITKGSNNSNVDFSIIIGQDYK